jgi:hypothetical protein
MTPPTTLQDLINVVRTSAPGDDPLGQLAEASRTAADLEQMGDALLGHFVDQSRRSGRSWSEISAALGVSRQAAHKRFSLGALSLDRFTQRAQRVLAAAEDEARALGHDVVGTEHLLLALFEPVESVAAWALGQAGLTREACEEQILALFPRGNHAGRGELPFTPRALDAVRGAADEAGQLGHDYIGTEHLLLALFRDDEALASRVLATLGAAYDEVKARIVEELSRRA